MKKRNLIVVNTYFQLITAVNMVMNNLSNDINDIVITDVSVGMKEKVESLKKSNIFENVYFFQTRELINGNKIKKYLLYLFNRNKILQNKISIKYDCLLFSNLEVFTYCLIDELFSKNKELTCSIYEEGFSTYTIEGKNNKINTLLRFLLFRKNIDKSIRSIYLYHPNLLCYKTNCILEQIPNLDKNNNILKNVLNSVFDYKKEKIKQKFLFFEEPFYCDNAGIDDFTLINDIANVVGKDNLIVKPHPRNKVDRFSKLGIAVWENTGIPWEIYQMNEDYEDKVFLTISSNCILASKLFFNENIKSYLLYNCTNKMSDAVTSNYCEYINLIKNNLNFENMVIPNNKEEFLNNLRSDI